MHSSLKSTYVRTNNCMINNNIQIHSKNKKSQTEIARATVTAA